MKTEFSSPGRIEIVGNHTDHNNGKVLVAAIGLTTKATAKPAGDGFITVKSEGYPDIKIKADDFALSEAEYGTSVALLRGTLQGFKNYGLKTGGFSAEISSNVPKGAGVSSSASYELLLGQMLNVFYNGGAVDKITLARIAQYAENVYMNKPCGLLDQMGIALGGVTYIDFANPAAPDISVINPDFGKYKIVIINTGGDHAHLTRDYADIRSEMHDVAGFFGKEVLADVPAEEFYKELPRLQAALSGRSILRAAHFFGENERVTAAADALRRGDLNTFFECVNASGESSYKLLQNCYSCTDAAQRIPLALFMSSRILKRGAFRVHGGGFAGTILAFVHEEDYPTYFKEMSAVFGGENIFVTEVRNLGVE